MHTPLLIWHFANPGGVIGKGFFLFLVLVFRSDFLKKPRFQFLARNEPDFG